MVRRATLLWAWLLAGCAGGGEAAIEGVCGGAVVYLDWVCRPEGWRLERVGEREWSCAAPREPPLAGRAAACRVATLRACDGVDDGSCDTTAGCDAPPPDAPCNPIGD